MGKVGMARRHDRGYSETERQSTEDRRQRSDYLQTLDFGPSSPVICPLIPMPRSNLPPQRDLIVAHSSDLHVDHDHTARLHGGDGAAGLACVLEAARAAAADVMILAGDTFDSHRLPQDLIDRAAGIIAAAQLPVVILPGNHDPAVP